MSGGDVGPLGKDAVTELHGLFKWAAKSPRFLKMICHTYSSRITSSLLICITSPPWVRIKSYTVYLFPREHHVILGNTWYFRCRHCHKLRSTISREESLCTTPVPVEAAHFRRRIASPPPHTECRNNGSASTAPIT